MINSWRYSTYPLSLEANKKLLPGSQLYTNELISFPGAMVLKPTTASNLTRLD